MKGHRNPQFIVDAMLKKMGKFLRIMGVDTIIAKDVYTDDFIIQKALKGNRSLITMDKLLYQKITKLTTEAILIKSTNLEDQLVQFFRDNRELLAIEDFNDPMSYSSRCSKCNFPLKSISKEDIMNRIPKETYTVFDRFWICSNESCKKIYWRGSHWKNIEKTINYMKRRMKESI